MTIKFTSESPENTFQIGKKIGSRLGGNEIILLSGSLGCGKTLMSKGIASAWEIDANDVVSPSFTLMNMFTGKGKTHLFHFDLYRLGPNCSIEDDYLMDYLGEGIIIIEWAQYLKPSCFQFAESIYIDLEILPDEKKRSITLSTNLSTFNDFTLPAKT